MARSFLLYDLTLVLVVLAGLGSVSGQSLSVSSASASGTVAATYTWGLSKQSTNSGSTLSVPLDGSGTANYQLTVSRTTTNRQVTVTGSFVITNNDNVNSAAVNPQLTFSTAPGGTGSPVVSCSPPGDVPPSGSVTCQFTASWADTSIQAGRSGAVTITAALGQPSVTAQYDFLGGNSRPAGSCATLTDSFVGGTITSAATPQMIQYTPTISGMQICDSADPQQQLTYTVTFSKLDSQWCNSLAPITATNQATLQILGDGGSTADTKSTSATVTLSLTGCTGATVSVGNIQTTVINSYTWKLEKTGGGNSLTTTPDQELSIPFTITATQTAAGSVGYVAGTISVQNTASSTATVSTVSVTISGQQAQNIPVSNCQNPTLTARGTTSCTFNVTNPSAPAAGTVTASVTLVGSSTAITSTPTSFDFQNAQTYNIGGTAMISDTVDTQGLQTVLTSTVLSGATLVRFEPAEQKPPAALPGLTIDGTRTFTYNMIVSRLMTCASSLTVSNVATLTPQQGSTQGSLTASAQATFSVTGCNVLPNIGLSNLQQWAAVTWSWSMQKTASPTTYQFQPGQGGNANYEVTLTRTRQSGNYWLSGTLTLTNPANFPMYISSVGLVSTSGQLGALPTQCTGGSTIGATTSVANVGTGLPTATPGLSGSFVIRAGAQINCVFNVTAGNGAPPSGQIQAMATTTSTVVGTVGNVAYSAQFPLNFAQPTQQWDIGGCVMFSDTATVSGFAGSWVPQLSGLPQQQQICDAQRVFPYTATITPVPATGAVCNQPITITNNAQAVPIGGGSTVTASTTIQVMAVNCAAASPVPGPVLPSPALPSPSPTSLTPVIVTVNPGVLASSGNYIWSVALTDSADGMISIPYTNNREVQYTVTAKRTQPTNGNTIAGQVTVANPNNAPVTVTGVTVTIAPAGGTTVPPVVAQCSSPYPLVLAAGGSTICTFNATVAGTDSGTVNAAAQSSAGSSTASQNVQYSFGAVSSSSGALGRCAVITDAVVMPAALANSTVSVRNNRAAGNAMPVCEDTTYTFTATFGPFPSASCSLYPVSTSATVTPQDGPQAALPPSAQTTVNLEIDNCPGQIADASVVSAVVDKPVAISNTTHTWTVTQAAADLKLNVGETGSVRFNVTWGKTLKFTSSLAGTVTVTNPTSTTVNISSVMVLPELSGKIAESMGAIPQVAALCLSTQLAPNSSTTCSYTTVISAGRHGTITAAVDLANGQSLMSAPLSFKFSRGTSDTGSGAGSCAEVTSGLMMSTALLQPGAAGAIQSNVSRVCDKGSTVLVQPLGSFTVDQCGTYMLISAIRVKPLSGSQQPFAVMSPATLTVTGCPLSTIPDPVVSIGPGLQANAVMTYNWKTSMSRNVTANPLVVQYNKPVAVEITGKVRKLMALKTVSVSGAVQLMSQGTSLLTVKTVQAAALNQKGELTIVNATCPEDSYSGSVISIPDPPAKVLCTFNISGLPAVDGPVLPLVYVRGSDAPLPTNPGIYRTANAPRSVAGDCVAVGASRSLTKEGSVVALANQPARAGNGLPSRPICRSAQAKWILTFGPFSSTECGAYDFKSDLTAEFTNGPGFDITELDFAVSVDGCPGR